MRERVKRLLLRLRDMWLILCITLLLLLVVEIGLSLVYGVLDPVRASRSAARNWRAQADVYSDASWVDDYYREFEESNVTRWTPYVYWRRQPYQGRYINVDANGLRRTWTCGQDGERTAPGPNIFLFGGSTLWGVGARDDYTIASLLSEKLAEAGIECRVTNFGESGYVSSQEIIALIQELRKGNVPDLVIFYDGVNDTYSAYQQQVAGLPQNEFNRIREFNLSQPREYWSLRRLCLFRSVDSLAVTRLARGILRRAGAGDPASEAAAHWGAAENEIAGKEPLLAEVLAVYRANVQFVKALGESYGFQSLFYWQPTIFDKKHLTVFEEHQRQSVEPLEPFYQEVSRLLRRAELQKAYDGAFHDVSGIFAEVREPLFIDWCHISEWGNGRIAERMAVDVAGLLGEDSRNTKAVVPRQTAIAGSPR